MAKNRGQKEVICGISIEFLFVIRIIDNKSVCDDDLDDTKVFHWVEVASGQCLGILQVSRSRDITWAFIDGIDRETSYTRISSVNYFLYLLFPCEELIHEHYLQNVFLPCRYPSSSAVD